MKRYSLRRKSIRPRSRGSRGSSRVYEEQIQEVRVGVLGDTGVGKSSFITNCVIDPVKVCSSGLPLDSPLPTTVDFGSTIDSTEEGDDEDDLDWDDIEPEMDDALRRHSLPYIQKRRKSSMISAGSDLEAISRTISDKTMRRKSKIMVELETAVNNFNEKPQYGMEYLSSLGIMSSREAAQFLFYTSSITPQAIGLFLGQNNAQVEAVRFEFVNMFDFRDKTYTECFRYFLANVFLPKESQQILRILETFGEVVVKQNNGEMKASPFMFSAETAYFLAFEILMLHSLIHKKNAVKKVKRKEFAEKLRFINRDIPKKWSHSLYKDIARFPLRGPNMDPVLPEGLSNPVYRRKFQYGPLVVDLSITEMSVAESIALKYDSFDGYIITFDVTCSKSFETAKRFLEGIGTATIPGQPRVTTLVGCKTDLEAERKVWFDNAQETAKKWGVDYLEVSNVNPDNLSTSTSSSASASMQLREYTEPVTVLENMAFAISEEKMSSRYTNSPAARESCMIM